MKRFLLMHIGFENPTPETMAAWGKWFERGAPQTIEKVGLRRGREVNRSGTVDLTMGPDSVTGYTIVSAGSFDEAHQLAASNPFVGSICIYELVTALA